jgi:protein-S-isoprenylcysteine O-methyltransferase Ste14
MKTFLGGKSKTLDRKSAMALAAINLLATPGLGTIMAGRVLVGLIQLGAAGAGFLLIMKWFYALFQEMIDGSAKTQSWQWQAGLLLFGIGWIGSLWSSINLVRAAPEQTTATPPKLDGSPG